MGYRVISRKKGLNKDCSSLLDARDIELALMDELNVGISIIVPNVSYGFLNHEADLLRVMPSGFLYEYEIKVSRADLRADFKKKKWAYMETSRNDKIKKFYYAVPGCLSEYALEIVPKNRGVISIGSTGRIYPRGKIQILREPVINKFARKLTMNEQFKIAKLGCMRIQSLSRKISDIKHDLKNSSKKKEDDK